MASPTDIKLYLSGGSSNTDPNLSLGGIRSTTLATSQTAVYGGAAISGVTLGYAAGNNDGAGSLRFDFASTSLFWTPFGGTEGAAMDVSADGDYVLEGGDKLSFLTITVVAASLPGSNASDTVNISTVLNALFDDVTEPESKTGATNYRCLYVVNEDIIQVKLTSFFKQFSTGNDGISVAWQIDDNAVTIVDESTEPVSGFGFDWRSAGAAAQGEQRIIAGSGQAPLWFRRTVPPYTLDPASPARWSLVLELIA